MPLITVTIFIKEAVTGLKDIASYGRSVHPFHLGLERTKRKRKHAVKKTRIGSGGGTGMLGQL